MEKGRGVDGSAIESIVGYTVAGCAAFEGAVLLVTAGSASETVAGTGAGNTADFNGSTGLCSSADVDAMSSCSELRLLGCSLSLLQLLLLMPLCLSGIVS